MTDGSADPGVRAPDGKDGSRPRIGITCSSLRAAGYYDPYLRAIEAAGATPVVISPSSAAPAGGETSRILAGVDGLIVPGGWDVSPEQYGGEPVAELTPLDRDLDRIEVALVRASRENATPVLGICRGQQLINVALGGSLLEHIEGHDIRDQPRDALTHQVTVEPGSELGRVAPATLMVNSIHHQAVRELAPGLRTTAWSPDHVSEAIQSSDGLISAVQAHPEELPQQRWAADLFTQFVARCRARAGAGG